MDWREAFDLAFKQAKFYQEKHYVWAYLSDRRNLRVRYAVTETKMEKGFPYANQSDED